MAQIRILESHIANKIAAGEVIERPVSVVKELIENAIDAHADHITLELRDGGLRQIKITDNGHGMNEEDLPMAFMRHATSKISSFDDLFDLKSFGFRGEALASIACIAQIEAISGQSDLAPAPAWRYRINYDEEPSLTKEAPRQGTIIDIKNLFYNVPARRKFVKSANYEFSLVTDLVSKYSFAYPQVSFVLSHQGKISFTTVGRDDVESRLSYVYGNELIDNIIHLKRTTLAPHTDAEAWLVNASVTRSNRQNEIIFVNGRLVQNRELSTIIEAAYETYIPKGRFPIALLKLEVPKNSIDVNVHPAKTIVKFNQMSRWQDELLDVLRDSIWESDVAIEVAPALCHNNVNSGENTPEVKLYSPPSLSSESMTTEKKSVPERVKDVSLSNDIEQNRLFTSKFVKGEPVSYVTETAEEKNNNQQKPITILNNRGFLNTSIDQRLEEKIKINELDNLMLLGQLNNTFILAQDSAALYIIDQHTCHERILYEKFMSLEKDKNISVQRFIIPFAITLSANEEQTLLDNILALRDLGVVFETTEEPRKYQLVGLPMVISEVNDYRSFITDLLENLDCGKKLTMAEIREEVITTASCKGAVKANWPLSEVEMHQLLTDMAQLKNPHSCPHGRPIVTKITMNQLYLLFKRGSFEDH